MNPLHSSPTSGDPALVTVIGLAGVASALILGLGLAALFRRQTKPYLLIVLALGTLVARTSVAALTMMGILSDGVHHLSEHALDVAMAGLVIAAVYASRTTAPDVTEGDV